MWLVNSDSLSLLLHVQGPVWSQLDALLDMCPDCAIEPVACLREACDTVQQERDDLRAENSSLRAQLEWYIDVLQHARQQLGQRQLNDI